MSPSIAAIDTAKVAWIKPEAQARVFSIGPPVNAVATKPVPAPSAVTLKKLFPGAPDDVVAELVEGVDWYRKADITTVSRMAMFLAQFGHETQNLRKLTENLNYSAERLPIVWPSRFRDAARARQFAHKPEALANEVYGGRMGNTQPGDGWLYRGRGPGLTGRDGYRAVGKLVGMDFEGQPDLVATPHGAFVAGVGIWMWKGLNASADREDVAANTLKLNGGAIGLNDRKALHGLAKVLVRG